MTLEQVLNDYGKLMYKIINNFVKANNIPHSHVDDIYQESCIRLFEKLPTYIGTKSSMKTFVSTNTDIACMRYRRAYFREDHLEFDEAIGSGSVVKFEDTTKIIDDYKTAPINKKIIYQKLYGYTQQEIADEFDVSQSKVCRILSEFRDYLVEELQN